MLYKCHIPIYILEKGIVKFEPLERQEVYDTMLLPHLSQWVNKRSMFPQAYLYPMNNAHFYLDIIENRLFYDPSLTHKGGSGGKSDRYLDSSHKVSQYLLIHSKAVEARLK